MADTAPSKPPWVWVGTTYFAEGFPYTLIRTVSAVFFRDAGMSLAGIGLTSLYGLPWIVKFLWGPHVDAFSTRRRWMLACQFLLAGAMVAGALVIHLGLPLAWVAVLFFLAAFVAATHDTAIDGYYMEALDAAGQARYVGYRVLAYRLAMMTGTGVVVTLGATAGWDRAYGGAGLLLLGLAVVHQQWLAEPSPVRRPARQLLGRLGRWLPWAASAGLLLAGLHRMTTSAWYLTLQRQSPFWHHLSFPALVSLLLFAGLFVLLAGRRRLTAWLADRPDSFFATAFLSYIDRERAGLTLACIVCIRAGEYMLSTMTAPFLVDLGLKLHYGWISGGVGLPASIAGAMFGGWCIGRFGLSRVLWPFLLAQNLTNLVYMGLAFHLAPLLHQQAAVDTAVLVQVAAVHGFDQFAGGLGTALLMTLLMRLCHPDHQAAHYAIGTGLMSVSGLYAGVLSGFLAQALGFAWFFGLSFLAALPGMALAGLVPVLRDEGDTGCR